MGGILGKIITNKYGLLIVGLLVLGAGFYMVNQTDVTCGSDVMSPGDICQTTRKGHTTESTYEEEKSSQHTGGMIAMGLGGAAALGGAGWIVVGLLRGKREDDETPAVDPVAAA
ncbi:hypothetical protein Cs7R123_71540 [Catellatospora sp. TT07R-123]|uniref:hypothetical protein n=1 Tax=Catellatospora sp. TT07R-123 TaxID=2733863 RepID=UPI001B264E19|nr:hypothetical protein [Catellatospora sp. TT07R-123]GHJ49812.1 hypothetical protein Cs7R123_71540 [Catellatospora sp. TT07R-123]